MRQTPYHAQTFGWHGSSYARLFLLISWRKMPHPVRLWAANLLTCQSGTPAILEEREQYLVYWRECRKRSPALKRQLVQREWFFFSFSSLCDGGCFFHLYSRLFLRTVFFSSQHQRYENTFSRCSKWAVNWVYIYEFCRPPIWGLKSTQNANINELSLQRSVKCQIHFHSNDKNVGETWNYH